MTRLLLLLCVAVGCVGQQQPVCHPTAYQQEELLSGQCFSTCSDGQLTVVCDPMPASSTATFPDWTRLAVMPSDAKPGDCFQLTSGRELRKVECGNDVSPVVFITVPDGWRAAPTVEVPLPEQATVTGNNSIATPDPIDAPAIAEKTAPMDTKGAFYRCPEGFSLHSSEHCEDIKGTSIATCYDGPMYCSQPTHCEDKRRILVGPDGNGRWFCHLPQLTTQP